MWQEIPPHGLRGIRSSAIFAARDPARSSRCPVLCLALGILSPGVTSRHGFCSQTMQIRMQSMQWHAEYAAKYA
jgi:hypothetical protein